MSDTSSSGCSQAADSTCPVSSATIFLQENSRTPSGAQANESRSAERNVHVSFHAPRRDCPLFSDHHSCQVFKHARIRVVSNSRQFRRPIGSRQDLLRCSSTCFSCGNEPSPKRSTRPYCETHVGWLVSFERLWIHDTRNHDKAQDLFDTIRRTRLYVTIGAMMSWGGRESSKTIRCTGRAYLRWSTSRDTPLDRATCKRN